MAVKIFANAFHTHTPFCIILRYIKNRTMTNPFKSLHSQRESERGEELSPNEGLEARTRNPKEKEYFTVRCILKVLLKLHLSHQIIMNFLLFYIYMAYLLNCTVCFYNKVLFTLPPLFIQNKTDSYPFISYSENIFSSLKLIDALL